MTRFLGSLRARLLLLHPSPNCSFRAESLVHVHFKEEIGVAELVPLVTTYIILFAYIYFSTCTSRCGGGPSGRFQVTGTPASGSSLGQMQNAPWAHKSRGLVSQLSLGGLGGSRAPRASQEKTPSGVGFPKTHLVLQTKKWPSFPSVEPGLP